jgi:drug/metabolite transporter (DMT)-like permease
MKKQQQAYVYALLAILCWSTIGTAFKVTLRYIGFIHLLLISSLVAVIVLFMIILVQGKFSLLRTLSKRQIANSAFLGFLNPFLYYLVLLKAYDLLPAQEAGTLNYIWPIALVLLSIPILKQKISLFSIAAILISFLGILVISTHGHLLGFSFTSPTGVLLALGSALFWAFYWIFNIKDPREEVTKLFLNFLFGFCYILITVLVFVPISHISWSGLAGSVYIGFFEMGVTFYLWLMALRLSSTTVKVSNLIYLSPFISLILIRFIVGEVILLSTVIGLILIVTGILMQQKIR